MRSTNDAAMNEEDAMLIAFAGLPSAGKSSAARALAALLGGEAFVEPEEADWPSLVRDRATVGAFTALSWFRSARVPLLFKASALAATGATAVVDSYYDVLIARYLGAPSFAWLLPEDDPYFPVARAMVNADWDHLPKADVLVMLHLDETVWTAFMERRGRAFDRDADLVSHFAMQELMMKACEAAARDHRTRLVVVDQIDGSPEQTARLVAEAIRRPAA